jgi:hypothetical protein
MSCRTVISVLMAAGAWTGCQSPQAPIPVIGEIEQLRGAWRGEYWSAQSGRSGTITFDLQATSDTARGDVMMTPAEPVARMPDPGGIPELSSRPQPLTISFVRCSEGGVSGRLDPYRDPVCGCLLLTTFSGRITADTIQGTFVTVHQDMGRKVEGQWRAVRTRER